MMKCSLVSQRYCETIRSYVENEGDAFGQLTWEVELTSATEAAFDCFGQLVSFFLAEIFTIVTISDPRKVDSQRWCLCKVQVWCFCSAGRNAQILIAHFKIRSQLPRSMDGD